MLGGLRLSGFRLSVESNQAIWFYFGFTVVRDWLSSLIGLVLVYDARLNSALSGSELHLCSFLVKAGVNVKAVLTSLNVAFWVFWERDIFSERIG